MERHVDRIARTLGVDPLELRRKNLLRVGDTTATGQRLDSSVGVAECVDRALEASGYSAKRALRPSPKGRTVRGVGASVFFHGAGFTGSGEQKLKGTVAVDLLPGGRGLVRSASTDIGQGTETVFRQIAAEAMGLPVDGVDVAVPSTAKVPDSGPTVASRTVMVVGSLVEKAAREIRSRVDAERAGGGGSFAEAADRLLEKEGPVSATAAYTPPPGIRWDDSTYTGDAYPVFGWACAVAEVEVDLDTFETRVVAFWSAVDVGRAIHPVMCLGQIEGGTLQAIGWALSEEVVTAGGKILNPRMTNYIVPTSLDAPPFKTILVEHPYAHGPSGAKGLGELPMDGAAPAIASAVEHATGLVADALPLLPERLFELAQGAKP
jgi:CO/xanthine dehydrogenase Mo-binding subunit